MKIDKVIESPWLRRPHWVHSSRLRAFLAMFFPKIKPNKLIPGDIFMLPDGTVIVDPDTYRILQKAIKNESGIRTNLSAGI